MQRRLTPLGWRDPAPSFPWGVALLVASGQSGAWRGLPGRSSVTGLPLPHLCRGSRWPGCRQGVGRSNRGRGMREEAEKARGVGWQGCCWSGGCLRRKCAGNVNELRSFMVICFPSRGAGQVLGWRNWGREPSWGAARLLGQGLP